MAAQALALLGLTCGQFRGLPLPLLILAMVAVLVQILTKHTRLGRALYAIGGNEEAAVLSGIPVGKVVVTAYTLLGALVGLTGLLQTAYAGASTTTVGELMSWMRWQPVSSAAACAGTRQRGRRAAGIAGDGFVCCRECRCWRCRRKLASWRAV